MSGSRSLIGLLALLATTISTLGQGTVYWGNASSLDWGPFAADRNVKFGSTFSVINPNLVVANVSSNAFGYDFSSLRAQLFYSVTLGTDIGTFTPVPETLGGISNFKQSTSTTAGSWFNKTGTLTGWDGQYGSSVYLAVVVWDVQRSTDALSTSARSGPWGMSSIFGFQQTASPFPWFDQVLNLQSFDINIPEPSVFALLGLGGLTLTFARRRHTAASGE